MKLLKTERKSSLLFSRQQIQGKLAGLARQVERDYARQELVLLTVLKGALCFTSDLMLELNLPFTLESIRCQSYGQRAETPGQLHIEGLDKLELHGKHVLVIDDICDSGQTLDLLCAQLQDCQPASLRSCVLLLRVGRERRHDPDYALFEIDGQAFVIGYGLDYKEAYRGLPGIYTYSKLD